MRVLRGWWIWLLVAAPAQANEIGASRLALDRTSPEVALWAEASPQAASPQSSGLNSDRARILLQSLTVPGWGQATLGHSTSAKVFGVVEAGIWSSFIAFRVQESMRRLSYENTAEIYAGIDLDGRNEEFRRVVGIYSSSDEYNRLVVYRDAANLYLSDPNNYDIDSYHAYIQKHSLKGDDTWAWDSFQSYLRYSEERKQTRRAALRANAMLGLAIANRLVSAIHAARYAGHTAPPKPHKQSWRIECGPTLEDPLAMRLGVRLQY
jgi:hypothetical protein